MVSPYFPKTTRAAKVWIKCAMCGKPKLKPVGSAYCGTKCQKNSYRKKVVTTAGDDSAGTYRV